MYKYLCVVFCIILIMFCSPNTNFVANVGEFSGTFYFNTSQNFQSSQSTTTQNGKGYIVSTQNKNAKSVYSLLDQDQIQGYALVSNDKINIGNFFAKLDATIIFCEEINNIAFYYAYTYKLPQFISYNNQKINLQVAIKDNTTTIGYPAILIGA